MKRVGLAAGVVFVAVAASSGGPERLVSDMDELRAALKAARPGDVIVMKDGTWKNAEIDFAAAATAASPIRLRAQTAGGVVLTGSSRLTFSAPHLVAEGLQFRGGALSGGSVIRFASDYGRLSETAVVDYNPPDPATQYAWVTLEGSDNQVERCTFKGKNNRRPVITNRPYARRNRVEACHFKDVAFHDENGREAVQILGYGMSEELGDDGAFFTLEGNLFEEAHGEGMEIVSIKSNRNAVRFNTFRKTKGGVTNRSGNFNVIEGNFILGEKEPRSYGIRLTGQHQRVVNNYVADVDGAGLLLVAGEYIEGALTPDWQPIKREGTPLGRVPSYAHVRNGTFAHNTFVNCGWGIDVGSSYKAAWPRAQRVLLPEDNRIANNLVWQPGGAPAVHVEKAASGAPFEGLRFQPNVYEANIVFGGMVVGVSSEGFRTLDPLLALEGALFRPAAKSPVIDAGAGSLVTVDMDGQSRTGKTEVGADEVSTAPILRRPLRPEDVGPGWLRVRRDGENPAGPAPGRPPADAPRRAPGSARHPAPGRPR